MHTSPPSHGRPAAEPSDWVSALTLHQRWLRAVILARCREAQAVEEILQEVALGAVRTPWGTVPADRVAPWLYRLAVRQSLLYRRKLGRLRRLNERVGRERTTRIETEPDPLAWLLAGERQQLVRQALGLLATRDAEILLLKYAEDWSYRTLAEHLGISESAVEARLHRARQRLRTELTILQESEVSR